MMDVSASRRRRASPARILRAIGGALHTSWWFPHIPLSAALTFAGGHVLWVTFGSTWGPLRTGVLATSQVRAVDVPYLLVGSLMMTAGVGLALRSHLAWLIGLVLTTFVVVFVFRFGHANGRYLTAFDSALAVALLLSRRTFTRILLAGSTLALILVLVPAVVYASLGSFYLGNQFSPPITSFFTGFYYAVETMTTVGYGDITPRTDEARAFTITIIFLGVGLLATTITAVVGPLVRSSMARVSGRQEGRRMERTNHFVITGATSLAKQVYLELTRRHQRVAVVMPERPEPPFDAHDVVVGDATDADVLGRANVDQARAVVVMGANDFENAFIILALKALRDPPKVVVVVNDAKHVARVKLARPDVIMTPSVVGGELLAMALTGEQMTGDHVIERLFNYAGSGDNDA
jgi:voltage-gated potassium channel